MTTSSRFRRFTGALTGLAGGLAGLTGAGVAAAKPQFVAPAQAPVAWVRYAETATQNITAWLEEDTATAFRAFLHQTRPAADQPTPPLALKVWIKPDGRIDRTEFTPFADEAANANLRAAIVGRRLPSKPPRGMLLPLRLAIQLEAGQPELAAAPTNPAAPPVIPEAGKTDH